jgi:hypothetical protein
MQESQSAFCRCSDLSRYAGYWSVEGGKNIVLCPKARSVLALSEEEIRHLPGLG